MYGLAGLCAGALTESVSGATKEEFAASSWRSRLAAGSGGGVYLDYNASAPLDARVAEAMSSVLLSVGNASSSHNFGRRQAALVGTARGRVAALVGGRPSGVVFTASATEANNLALCGLVRTRSGDRARILVSAVEHASVWRTAKWLAEEGIVAVDIIPVRRGGYVDVQALERLLGPDVLLVSVMAANGETGVVNPIAHVSELVRAHGALLHCDATQYAGRMLLSTAIDGVDLVSVSAHKLGGPMGIGALIGTHRVLAQMQPLIHGGGHERGLRSGSLNVPAIVGFGVAADLAADDRMGEASRQAELRDSLAAGIEDALPGAEQIGDVERRLPNTVCFRFAGAEADAVKHNMEPVAVSTGSACSSRSIRPSRVLLSMGLSRSAAYECVRFSVGPGTVAADIEAGIAAASEAVEYVRPMTSKRS